jgi:hypothetical protein
MLPKYVKIKIHKQIILPTIFYGYETWTLTIWEKYRRWVSRMVKSRSMIWPWQTVHEQEINAYIIVAEEKKPLGRPWHRK